MLPPYTDDDESQDERGQQSPQLDLQGRRIVGYGKSNDETPSINAYKQALNLNSSNNISQQSQKKQSQNFMTFNEISEMELSGSQFQTNDGQNDRVPKDSQYENDRIPQRITEDHREDEQSENSDINSSEAMGANQGPYDFRRQKNQQETANSMYQLAGAHNTRVSGLNNTRQKQFQTAADMSGYEGDQDHYRGNSRGRFQGGKIESRKKKKATQQLAAARNANKKYKDAYQAQTQSLRTSQKKGSVTVPMSSIELNIDDQMLQSQQIQPLNVPQSATIESNFEKQQTGISAVSGVSGMSLISGNSGISGVNTQQSEKQGYKSIQQTLKPQSQIVDIQVEPNSGVIQRGQTGQNGLNEINISEAYLTNPHTIEVDALKIQHESQPIMTAGDTNTGKKNQQLKGRTSPIPETKTQVIDLTGISGTSSGIDNPNNLQQHQISRREQHEALMEKISKMSSAERKKLERESATRIQKWVRGHITRKTTRKQKEINFKQMRKLRRMLSVAYGKTRTKLVKQLMHVLKESGNLHSDQNYQLWKKYQAHCATIIQRHWRGYSLRYLQIEKFNETIWKHKQSRLLCALVRGYKTRLLLHEDGYHQGISRVKTDIQRVANQDNGKALIIDVNDKLTLKNLMKRRRLKVIDLIRLFNKAYQQKGIIGQLLNQKRKLAAQEKQKYMGNQSRFSQESGKMLDSVLGSHKSLKNVSTLLDYNSSTKGTRKSQKQNDRSGKPTKYDQLGDQFRGSFQNKAHKLQGQVAKGSSFESEPASGDQFRGSFSPAHDNTGVDGPQNSDEQQEANTGTLWPSQAHSKAQNTSKQSSDLSSMWPSAQHSKQTEECDQNDSKTGSGFASFWPSVQQQNKKDQFTKARKEVVLEERDEQNSDASGDVDWLALPITKKKDPPVNKEASTEFERPQEDRKTGDGTAPNKYRNFDDEPVGKHTWNPDQNETNKSTTMISQNEADGSKPLIKSDVLQIDDIPIKPAASNDPSSIDQLQLGLQRSSNMSDKKSNNSQSAVKGGYDFEKMIEAAMEMYGEAAAPMAPKENATKSSSGVATNLDDKIQKKEREEKTPTAQDEKKKELLLKRKKYDPRAAIKQQKKQQQNPPEQETPESSQPADILDNKGQQSRIKNEKMNRSATPVAKQGNEYGIDEEQPQPPTEGGPLQDQNMPAQQPRPYLKRKTKAVKVEKGNQYKVEGKSRIDCWQKGDKESTGGNQITYGNRKRKRQSLLKKNQESKTKIGLQNDALTPGARPHGGDMSMGASPSPFRLNPPQRLNYNKPDASQDFGNGIPDQQQYMMAVDPADNEYSEIVGGPDSYGNQGSAMGAYPSYNNDPHNQFTDSLLPSSHLSTHLPVNDLETQFDLLHGPNQEQFKIEVPQISAGLSSMDRAVQRQREKQLQEMKKDLNSHEFKYSMIPFSAFNNSQEVNLYKATSQIPYLFKDPVSALQKSADFQKMNQAPSLFFKCYSDDLYEAILEDYRSHYVAISNQDLDEDDDGDVEEGDEYEEQ